RPMWQRLVRGGEIELIVNLTVGRTPAVKSRAVPRCDALLRRARRRGDGRWTAAEQAAAAEHERQRRDSNHPTPHGAHYTCDENQPPRRQDLPPHFGLGVRGSVSSVATGLRA